MDGGGDTRSLPNPNDAWFDAVVKFLGCEKYSQQHSQCGDFNNRVSGSSRDTPISMSKAFSWHLRRDVYAEEDADRCQSVTA